MSTRGKSQLSNTPEIPCMRDKFGWYDSHKKQVASLRHSDASVLLIGDSIIAGLQRYRNVWRKYFKHQYESLNFGIDGD